MKKPIIDNELADAADRHSAKVSALLAGVSKFLTEFIAGNTWGNETTIEVAIDLLQQAKQECHAGRAKMEACRRGPVARGRT
jgi:hypothetical protein